MNILKRVDFFYLLKNSKFNILPYAYTFPLKVTTSLFSGFRRIENIGCHLLVVALLLQVHVSAAKK